MTTLTELHESVTAQVVAQIEAGAGTWRMPWQTIAETGQPVNAQTHKAYRGGNHMILGMVAMAQGWSGTWATYKQWQSLGAQVRKGERSTMGIKWSVVEDRKHPGEHRLVPFVFSVFGAEQVDGWEIPATKPRNTIEAIENAEAFFATVPAAVHHGGNHAAYLPKADHIILPMMDQFNSAADYYSTRAHESAHWTGNSARLDRDLTGRFGSDSYAAEELVAELSAAFTCCQLGISQAPRPDHASYLATWLKVLKADASALFAIASKAQAATDYLTPSVDSVTELEVEMSVS